MAVNCDFVRLVIEQGSAPSNPFGDDYEDGDDCYGHKKKRRHCQRVGAVVDIQQQRSTSDVPKLRRNPVAGDLSAAAPGAFVTKTQPAVFTALNNITSLAYPDNGEFCFPFVKVETSRVFFPVQKNNTNFNFMNPNQAWANFFDFLIPCSGSGTLAQNSVGSNFRNIAFSYLKPFPACVCPRSINYAQRSTRYMYGPWITNIDEIPFRGNVEYEQDDSLLPENFLIPLGFGAFGDFSLNQISGLAGLGLAAQGRANAIDNFALFAQEQGSITIQSPPAIKRIGDALYGIQQVSDIKVSVNNSTINTTYSFKTISPRFGRNNKDVERRLTRISNKLSRLNLI